MGILETNATTISKFLILVLLVAPQTRHCNEIVFDASSSSRAASPSSTSSPRNSLEKSLNNLVLVDQIYRENIKQSQLLLECNQKLATLEFELNKAMNSPSSTPMFGRPLDAWNASNPIGKLLKSLQIQLIDYFKNELERNYRVINDLQAKLQNLNKTIMSSDNLPFGGSIDRLPNQFPYHGSNKSIPLDCTMMVGTGFIQIDLSSSSTSSLSFGSSQQARHHDATILNKVAVYCEFGWLVIHQRLKGFETNFNRTWKDYSLGFGSLKSDFWLGLEIVHRLTQQRPHELLVELTDWSDQLFIAKYETFEVSSEQDQYRLGLSGTYSGNASKDFLDDAFNGMSSQNGAPFSTLDKWRPQQQSASGGGQQQSGGSSSSSSSNSNNGNTVRTRNCALRSGGGWWFANQQSCLPVNLNGVYVNGASAPSTRGIKWQAVRPFDRNYSLKRAKMKIRPKFGAAA